MARYAHLCNSGMNVMGITNYFLNGFKFYFIRWIPYLTLISDLESEARQVRGHRGDPDTIILLDRFSIEVIPNDLLLDP